MGALLQVKSPSVDSPGLLTEPTEGFKAQRGSPQPGSSSGERQATQHKQTPDAINGRSTFRAPSYDDEGSSSSEDEDDSENDTTDYLPGELPGAKNLPNYRIIPQPPLQAMVDYSSDGSCGSDTSFLSSLDRPSHLHPPSPPYNPYKRDPTAASPTTSSPRDQLPSDRRLTENLPPRLYDTPIDWGSVRQASMQRSCINPFAEPRRRRVTRQILQLHIPPETWYGAGTARPAPITLTPDSDGSQGAWSPSALASSMGATLHALQQPIRNVWSPVYTREELIRQEEEQAPNKFIRSVRKALSLFWNGPEPPPPSPAQLQRHREDYIRQYMQARHSHRRQSQKRALQAQWVQAQHAQSAQNQQVAYEKEMYTPNCKYDSPRTHESLHNQTPMFNPDLYQHHEAAVDIFEYSGVNPTDTFRPEFDTPVQYAAGPCVGPGNNPGFTIYGSPFDPSHKRRVRTPASRSLQPQPLAAPHAQSFPATDFSREAIVQAVERAAMYMRADRRDDAREAIGTIRAWLGQQHVQDFLAVVGVWMTAVAVLKWLNISPTALVDTKLTVVEPVTKMKGFSYVKVLEVRMWSVGKN
ncbi:hypothetical protein BROUX41_000521 [Berkeleyomyces rouxiae]|uniref:uncharacterized protein n=1 Tax=Berkeleyomyces rouxiae TaxID=2035830 RepID=UPI003B75F87A